MEEKKKKRRGLRPSKSERLAKRCRRVVGNAADETLEEAISLRRFDHAERLALELDDADAGNVENTVLFLKSLRKRKTLRHYVERASRLEKVRTSLAKVLLPELVEQGRLQDAIVVSPLLGVPSATVAAAALDDDDDDNDCSIRGVLDAALARDLFAAAAADAKRVTKKWTTVLRSCAEIVFDDKAPPLIVRTWRDYCRQVNEEERKKRRAATEKVAKVVGEATPSGCLAFAFGSTATELDGPEETPDVDVNVITRGSLLLEDLASSLRARVDVSSVLLVPARVPTIRCIIENYDVDVVANNLAAVCNTAMLTLLKRRYPQFVALNLLARRFSRIRDVRGSRRRHLSSYAWTLLCIRAMQKSRNVNNQFPVALDFEATREIVRSESRRDEHDDPDTIVSMLRGAVQRDLDRICGSDITLSLQKDGYGDEDLFRSFVELLRIVAFSPSVSLRGDDAVFLPRRRSSHRRLRIEDPIELEHDLGTTLTNFTLAKLRHSAISALCAVAQSGDLSHHFGW